MKPKKRPKKRLRFMVGKPVDALRRKKRYLSPVVADMQYLGFSPPRPGLIMFIYRDDELVWAHDWDYVYQTWRQEIATYEPHREFFKDFYHWAVSVWGP